MFIQSNAQLIESIENGLNPKFIFFWGHRKNKSTIGKSCFSQWYEASFKEDGVLFPTAEHYMMYHKAKLFNCAEIAEKVLRCAHPGEAKKLGRQVTGFDDNIWNRERFDIVVNANLLKFEQNPNLLGYLLGTGSRVLVEASPVDSIWGIGLATDHPDVAQPQSWKGLNLLGYALMAVREKLSEGL